MPLTAIIEILKCWAILKGQKNLNKIQYNFQHKIYNKKKLATYLIFLLLETEKSYFSPLGNEFIFHVLQHLFYRPSPFL